MPLLKERPARKLVVEKTETLPREYRKFVVGGLAGFSGVALLQLLGVGHIDKPLTIALCAFVIAIPLLAKDLLDALLEERYGITVDFDQRFNATAVGILAAFIGIGSLVWHYSGWMGALFVAISFWCFYSHDAYRMKLSETAKHPRDD